MHDILRDTPIYQEILQEGREEERQQRLQALRQLLLKIVQAHFPDPKIIRLAQGQSAIIQNPELLQDLILKVSLAQSLEQAQQYLLDWPDARNEKH